jgi:pyridoxal 5'-phosphate synthase pdxS subunit
MASAVVEAVENYEDYKLIGEVSSNIEGMAGIDIDEIPENMKLQQRGW